MQASQNTYFDHDQHEVQSALRLIAIDSSQGQAEFIKLMRRLMDDTPPEHLAEAN